MKSEVKGIWQGGITKTNSKMSEEEAKFWRGFEDYNDKVGLESDFAPEYNLEKEMRQDSNKVPTPVSGMGGRGGPVDGIRYANKKETK